MKEDRLNRQMSEAAKKKDMRQTALLDWNEMPEEIHAAIETLRDKKVEDLRVYDMRGFTPFCDFVILGTVLSSAQARVARNSIVQAMESSGIRLYGVEGEDDSNWLLIDFWDLVVHLFRPETRDYYNLEALWADLPWWPGEIE